MPASIDSRLLEMIVANISDGIYVIQGNRILFHNERFAEIFGYSSSDALRGRDIYASVYPDPQTVDVFRSANEQALTGSAAKVAWGQPTLRRDGSFFWMEVEARRIDIKGKPAIFGTILDRTDCKLIGEAMHVSQETLRLLFDAMEDRVYVVTKEYKLIYANRKMKEGLLGDMASDPCYKACRGLSEECEDCSKDKVFASDTPIHKEFFHTDKKKWYSVIELAIRMPGVDSPTKLAVARDVTSRKEAEEKVRALSHSLITAQEEERRNLSRELHDDLGQRLNAVKMGIEALMNSCQSENAEMTSQAERLCEILDSSIHSVRDISWGLRPPVLERLGLVETIRDHCRMIQSMYKLEIDFKSAGTKGLVLDPAVEINLFRILQEALHNVVKHAGAKSASVRLVVSHPQLIMRVDDNGNGFDKESVYHSPPGLGLVGIAERMDLLGGVFDVQSKPGKGTHITIEVPLPVAQPDKEPGARMKKVSGRAAKK